MRGLVTTTALCRVFFGGTLSIGSMIAIHDFTLRYYQMDVCLSDDRTVCLSVGFV